MSTKLLDGEAADAVRLVAWPLLDGVTAPPAASPSENAAPAPASSAVLPSPQPDLSHVVAAQQRRIQELEQDLLKRPQDAFEQGRAAGNAEATSRSDQLLKPVVERFSRTIEDLSTLRRRIRSEVEEDTVRLALMVARKILHREVTVDPDALNGLVRAALARIDSRELHRVRLHPDDIPAVQRFLDAAGMPSQVDVLADPSLERGGAVFETTRGTLDASIATQMSEIERGFLDIVRRSHERG